MCQAIISIHKEFLSSFKSPMSCEDDNIVCVVLKNPFSDYVLLYFIL